MGVVTKTAADNLAVPWTDAVTKDLFTKIGYGLVSQVVLETLQAVTSNACVSQVVLETLQAVTSNACVSQVVLETLVALTCSITITDSLTLSDEISTFLDTTILKVTKELTDDLSLQQGDSLELRFDTILQVSDDSNLLNDSIEIGTPVYLLDFSDNLDNWNDLGDASFPELYTDISEDNLDSWADEVLIDVVTAVEILDSFAWYDDIEVQLWVFFNSQTVNIQDTFYDWEGGGLSDELSYFFDAEESTFAVGDLNRLNDSIKVYCELLLDIEDNLDNWNDGVTLMPGEFVDYAYDTMMYNFLDSIEIDLRQHRTNNDTLSLSDAIIISFDVFLQTKTIADNLSSWLDSVSIRLTVHRSISDDFALYDSIQTFMTTIRSISDSLILSDSIIVSLLDRILSITLSDSLNLSDSVQTVLTSSALDKSDSLSFWNDLVNAELKYKLEISKGDSFSLSDEITNSGIEEDVSYYRRYLNDVIQ